MEKYEVSVFNTITKKYEMVEVSKEVYEFYSRDTWRCEKQENRYYNRKLAKSEVALDMEDLDAYADLCQRRFDDAVAKEDEAVMLEAALKTLNDQDRDLIEAIYFKNMSESSYASLLGISQQAVHKRKERILKKLKEEISKLF